MICRGMGGMLTEIEKRQSTAVTKEHARPVN